MKTKSIRSIAALVGVTVVLSASALAGPGPQPLLQARKVSEKKEAVVTYAHVQKAPSTAKSVIKMGPALTYVSGPHGDNFTYRW